MFKGTGFLSFVSSIFDVYYVSMCEDTLGRFVTPSKITYTFKYGISSSSKSSEIVK